MHTVAVNLTVQRWGNSLAVRIPAAIARSAHFHTGTPVKIILEQDGISVKSIANTCLTLDERLALFDPKKHGAEAMAFDPTVLEKFE